MRAGTRSLFSSASFLPADRTASIKVRGEKRGRCRGNAPRFCPPKCTPNHWARRGSLPLAPTDPRAARPLIALENVCRPPPPPPARRGRLAAFFRPMRHSVVCPPPALHGFSRRRRHPPRTRLNSPKRAWIEEGHRADASSRTQESTKLTILP
jgi:hypothetical protein